MQPILAVQVQELAQKCNGSFPVVSTSITTISRAAHENGAGYGGVERERERAVATANGAGHAVARVESGSTNGCWGFVYGLCVGFPTVSTSAAQGSRTEQGEEASSTLMKWCQVQGTELEDRVCWPRIKHLDERGLHKLLFFYHGDV